MTTDNARVSKQKLERFLESNPPHPASETADIERNVNDMQTIRHDANNLIFALRPKITLLIDHLSTGHDPADSQAIQAISDGVGFLHSLLNHAANCTQSKSDHRTDFHRWWNATYPLLCSVLPEHVRLLRVRTGKLPLIAIPPIKLTQAILNLLTNAGDAMVQHSIQHGIITVEVIRPHNSSHDSMLSILLHDNAGGLSPKILNDLLKRNVSTKPGNRGGLGLRIVHDIVHEVGGDIHIFSTPGVGTTIRLELPLAKDAPPTSPKTATNSAHSG